MALQKTIPTALRTAGVDIATSPFTVTVHRFFGLDIGDWSIVLLGIAFAGSLLLALV